MTKRGGGGGDPETWSPPAIKDVKIVWLGVPPVLHEGNEGGVSVIIFNPITHTHTHTCTSIHTHTHTLSSNYKSI